MTAKVIAQLLLAAKVPPVSLTPKAPATNAPPVLLVSVPPQVLLIVRGVANIMLVGKVSVKVSPVNATKLGLLMVMVNVLVLPKCIKVGDATLVAVIGVKLLTFNVAEAACALGGSDEVAAPAAIALM